MTFLYKLTFCRFHYDSINNYRNTPTNQGKFVSSCFYTGSWKVNKITTELIFCIKLYVYEQSKYNVVIYLHLSLLYHFLY